MRFLLDSHAFLWCAFSPERLSAPAREAIENPDNEILVSIASVWEISIKAGLGRLQQPEPLETIMTRRGFQPLGISLAHASAVGGLPRHHGDPFDRMLIAQAQSEGLTLVTRDRAFSAYGIPLLKA